MCQTFHQHFFAVCDGHGQNGRLCSLLIKLKFADHIQDFIAQGKAEQKAKVNLEPDPEEKDEAYYEQINQQEEKIITDALYNSVIKAQFEQEINKVFNV